MLVQNLIIILSNYNTFNKKENILDKDFNLKEWVDSWLTTKGINNLEPIIEYNSDKSIRSFKIK
jgi:hypothetical protein